MNHAFGHHRIRVYTKCLIIFALLAVWAKNEQPLCGCDQCDKDICEWLLGRHSSWPGAADEHVEETSSTDGHHCVRGLLTDCSILLTC